MKKEFWFIVGSQDLYGEEVLRTVATRAQEMATELSKALPYPLVYKVTAMSNSQISDVIREANYDDSCYGIIKDPGIKIQTVQSENGQQIFHCRSTDGIVIKH